MRNLTERNIIKEFLESPLFKGCDLSFIELILNECVSITKHSSGSVIMSHGRMMGKEESAQPSIAYVASGRCLISSCSKTRSILRTCEEKELIGLAGVFASNDIETKVIAYGGKRTTILSISKEDLESLMSVDKTNSIRDNLFKMLATKISFLNKKIANLTGGEAKKKLAAFLLGFEKEKFEIGLSMSDLSSMLDIGRSSLYRSIDGFEEVGAIRREGGTIAILDKEYLEKI